LKSGSRPSTPPGPEHPGGADALVEFEVLADADGANVLGDALLEAGAMAVSVEDADAGSDIEQPLFGEPGSQPASAWRLNRLRVLVGPGEVPARLLARAVEAVGGTAAAATSPVLAARAITDQDWVRASQAGFAPQKIGRLWVVPSWAEPPEPAALNLRLDPGMAFGTGTHPSTRLCLAWLQSRPLDGLRVLDYGCGSGILAIAAARLGAAEVHGVDIDPLACNAARENSARNGVQADYTAPDSMTPEACRRPFDLVLANILANPLIVLAPVLLRHLADNGWLVLSGVLTRQAPALAQAYSEAEPRLALSIWDIDGDWACLAGRRTER
jgi:ribosomal protein L11 methyltransferase